MTECERPHRFFRKMDGVDYPAMCDGCGEKAYFAEFAPKGGMIGTFCGDCLTPEAIIPTDD